MTAIQRLGGFHFKVALTKVGELMEPLMEPGRKQGDWYKSLDYSCEGKFSNVLLFWDKICFRYTAIGGGERG